ncbi:MAG: hypothetical protein SO023_01335 [Eubacterium sp.]|nr:hypothetical protein [Eubacterium sp.]
MRRKLISIALACALVLGGCGNSETEKKEQTDVSKVKEEVRYESNEMSLPDLLQTENASNMDYLGNSFDGFVADLQGKPAVYSSDITLEDEEYNAAINRWTLDEKGNWETDQLCDVSLSEFLNNRYEQKEWMRCKIQNFRRGDNGNLYAIFVYYEKADIEVNGEVTDGVAEKYSILEMDEENDSVYEIPLEVAPQVREDFGRRDSVEVDWITDYHIYEDGNILLICGESGGGYGYYIDGETGKILNDLGSVISSKTRFAYGESEMMYYSKALKSFEVLSIPDLEEQNKFGENLGEDVLGKDWYFYMDPDTWQLYMFNGESVYRVPNYQSGQEIDSITSATTFDNLAEGRATVMDFFVGENEDIYICLVETTEEYGMESSTYRMVHYTKVS